MANTQALKTRIKSVKSTKQITKAMELVAASKMRRAQEATLKTRAYTNSAREILTEINKNTDVSKHPLFTQRPVLSKLYVVITGDRGLAGAYNINVLKRLTSQLKDDMSDGIQSKLIVVGKQGARFVAKLEGVDVIGVYENFPDNPGQSDVQAIIDSSIDLFTSSEIETSEEAPRYGRPPQKEAEVDQVVILYTDFKSSITQTVEQRVILPATFQEAESPQDLSDIPFEPSPAKVLETITPRLIAIQFLQAILESQASEHSMRMMAMKNASDNAGDIIDDLTLAFNTARQAAVTQELAEITGGAAAVA